MQHIKMIARMCFVQTREWGGGKWVKECAGGKRVKMWPGGKWMKVWAGGKRVKVWPLFV